MCSSLFYHDILYLWLWFFIPFKKYLEQVKGPCPLPKKTSLYLHSLSIKGDSHTYTNARLIISPVHVIIISK